MPSRRANPNRIKQHRSYSVDELADCCGVHKNTVRGWQRNGLKPIDSIRPILFQGAAVRDFLTRRSAGRKRPCRPGTLYCFRCRSPRRPALGMVDFIPMRPGSGNLRALCESCEAIMHRRVCKADIAKVMPGCAVQFAEGRASLSGQVDPSLNCDSERRG